MRKFIFLVLFSMNAYACEPHIIGGAWDVDNQAYSIGVGKDLKEASKKKEVHKGSLDDFLNAYRTHTLCEPAKPLPVPITLGTCPKDMQLRLMWGQIPTGQKLYQFIVTEGEKNLYNSGLMPGDLEVAIWLSKNFLKAYCKG